MFTCRVDMSLRDVTIAQMGNGGSRVRMTSRTRSARKIWGDFEKVSRVEMRPALGEDGWFLLACGDLCGRCHICWGGADEKARIERLCLSLSLCRRTFKLKDNKVSYLNKEVVTCLSNFVILMFYLYGHSMYISHVAISWLWYTALFSFSIFSQVLSYYTCYFLVTILLTDIINDIESTAKITAFSISFGVMVKAMNCGIVVCEFVLQSRYYVHFRANTLGKGMNPLILPPAMGK